LVLRYFNSPATTALYTFPYTTLFRSGVEAYGVLGFAFALMLYAFQFADLGLEQLGPREVADHRDALEPLISSVLITRFAASAVRSEEHTSELQSRENLVCRLLLEKKK